MIAYICNCCKKPIDLDKRDCAHFEVILGKKAIVDGRNRIGDRYSVDLCEPCYKKIAKEIDVYYYGGNDYLKDGGTENG